MFQTKPSSQVTKKFHFTVRTSGRQKRRLKNKLSSSPFGLHLGELPPQKWIHPSSKVGIYFTVRVKWNSEEIQLVHLWWEEGHIQFLYSLRGFWSTSCTKCLLQITKSPFSAHHRYYVFITALCLSLRIAQICPSSSSGYWKKFKCDLWGPIRMLPQLPFLIFKLQNTVFCQSEHQVWALLMTRNTPQFPLQSSYSVYRDKHHCASYSWPFDIKNERVSLLHRISLQEKLEWS